MRKHSALSLLAGGGVAASLAIASLLAQPATVSPGRPDAFSRTEARCPTFSWAAVDGADQYVVMVFELGDETLFDTAASANADLRPVLQRKFPGSVYSWTPDLDACLASAGRYAWVVQSRVNGSLDRSEPRFFSIADVISTDEQLEAAVRRVLASADSRDTAMAEGVGISSMRRPSDTSDSAPGTNNLSHGPGLGIDGDGTVKANAYLFNCESPAPAFVDADGDTFGDNSTQVDACVPPVGYSATGGDCDDTDDAIVPGSTRSCYTGPNGTEGVGLCTAGLETCSGGMFGSCVGEVTPQPELCNSLDDNCDGQTDEGNPEGGGACNTGLPGVCAAGTSECQGGGLSCNQNQQASAETCNGLDDNCDGATDEGNPGGGGACSTGLPGICNQGTLQCQTGTLNCLQDNPSTEETCNGLDDDCDGSTDEGNPGGGGDCNTGLQGICAPGTLVCQGGSLSCSQNNQPTPEDCFDEIDNDCDGLTDDTDPDCSA